MREDQISLQLYTVREHTARDIPATLRRLAEIGYTAVELAGYGSLSPEDIRRLLDDLGLRASGAHISLDSWEKDPEAVISDMHALGCTHAVVPIIPLELRDEDAVARLAESFNRWGELCCSEGIAFSYHNHAFEFAPLGETTMWDLLLQQTDPRLVHLELDLYWVRYGGGDPETVLRDLGERVSLVHLKDMADDERRSDLPVGEGTLPWQGLLQAAEAAGVEWYIAEQDNPRDAFEDVQSSLRHLRGLSER